MIILRQKSYSIKSIAGYGTGYIVGGLIGDKIGGMIGGKIKRDLNEKDLDNHRKQLKSREEQINYIKSHNFHPNNIERYYDDDDVVFILCKYGVSYDNPDDFNYQMLNKNKQKIIKEIEKLKNHNRDVLKNPEKYPGNYETTGSSIGSMVGIAGGLLAAHKFLKKK